MPRLATATLLASCRPVKLQGLLVRYITRPAPRQAFYYRSTPPTIDAEIVARITKYPGAICKLRVPYSLLPPRLVEHALSAEFDIEANLAKRLDLVFHGRLDDTDGARNKNNGFYFRLIDRVL